VSAALFESLTTLIEREDGLPCGRCGGRHVASWEELESDEQACTCRCCDDAFAEQLAADFPDLIITRGGARVITEAAVGDAIRRTEADC